MSHNHSLRYTKSTNPGLTKGATASVSVYACWIKLELVVIVSEYNSHKQV
jgi:hypothetical protein